MSDTKNPGDKKLVGSKTLTLKRGVEQGTVRQSFSHGRSKQVVVEKVKRRVIGAGDAKPEAAPLPEAPVAKGLVKALVGAGAETVHRYGEGSDHEFWHWCLLPRKAASDNF